MLWLVHSAEPSVTLWMSVVAPPTSITRASPRASAKISAASSTAPGVGRISKPESSVSLAIPGALTMCWLKTSWISVRTGSIWSTSTSGKTLSAHISST